MCNNYDMAKVLPASWPNPAIREELPAASGLWKLEQEPISAMHDGLTASGGIGL